MRNIKLIKEINQMNTTATVEFLGQFSADKLSEYLGRLKSLNRKDLSAAAQGFHDNG